MRKRLPDVLLILMPALLLAGCPQVSVVVPDVVTMDADRAVARMESLLLEVVVTEDYSSTVAAGYVISQDPPAPTVLEPGDTVTLTVSRGTLAIDPVTVKVGVVLPLSGPMAKLGREAVVAVHLAFSAYSTYVPFLDLQPVVLDSAGDPDVALDALAFLDGLGVQLVVGPLTSDEAAAMVGYADEHGMMLLSPSSTAVSLALPDNLFRVVPNDGQLAGALAMALSETGYTRVLPVYMEGLYGTDMMAALVDWGSGMETGFSVLQGVSFDIAAVDYAALAAAVEDAAASLSAEDTALLLVGREEDAAGLFAAAGPESPLAGFKWYATDGVVQQASVLADADAATFALSAGLEGFASTWSPSMSVVPQQLAAALMAAELGQAPSPTVLGAWDAAAAVAEVLVGTLGDETSWLHLMVTSNLNHMESVRGGSAAVDENGDASTATYSRFRVGEGPAGAPAWLPEGLYVRTATWGPALVGESARATEEQGVVTLGAVLPITGVNAGYGTGALSAIYLAVEHVNLYNTLVADTGLTFAVDVRDSRSDPAVALAQVQALHDLGVNLVLGPLTSSELAAAADYINDNGMVAIGPLSTAVALAQPDHILRLTANDTHQAHALNRLITEQGRDTVVMLHGDDIYGAGLAEAFAADFTGTVTDIAYPADTTDYADALAAAEAAVAQAADRTRTAVLVVGHGELVGLLESVPAGPLHEVAWYGTDGLALSRELLASPGAVAFARETNLTCSIYDLEARPGLMPMLNVVRTYLEPLVGGEVGWNEFSAYDAVWMAAAAHAVSGVTPDADTLWDGLTSDNSVDNVGLTGFHILDENGDQSDSYYAFYVLSEATGSLGWWSIAWYRDIYGARDELHIYPVYKGNQ